MGPRLRYVRTGPDVTNSLPTPLLHDYRQTSVSDLGEQIQIDLVDMGKYM